MEEECFVRRRCKTPVLWIGQLESKSSQALDSETATCLADQYRAELPDRIFTPTPCVEPDLAKPPPRRLRKIKCQSSLRDIIKEQEHAKPAVYSSDSDTLCGSESPSPSTATTTPTRSYFEIQEQHNPPDDIALHICTSLLTNELAKSLYKHHPAEQGDRASGLQILLMIEAYEALQHKMRNQAAQFDRSHVDAVDGILDRWLDALYTIYEHSQGGLEDVQEAEEIEGALWRSKNSQDVPCTISG